MKVRIKMTYRGIPYEVEMEAGDKIDVNFLLHEVLGGVIDKIQNSIDAVLAKEGSDGRR